MNTDKMKDMVLRKAYGRSCADPKRIEGDQTEVQSAIVGLHNEGLVRILHIGNNRGTITVMNYEITPLGTELVNNGGYAKSRRKASRKKVSDKMIRGIWAIALLVLGALIDRIISLLF